MSEVQSTVGNLGNKKQRVRIETNVFSRGWNLLAFKGLMVPKDD